MTEKSSHEEANWLLDREAGAGWRDEGMDDQLRGAISRREQVVDKILRHKDLFGEIPADLQQEFTDAWQEVRQRKQELGIDDPPPLSTEEE